ncbi:MAG: chemotaxis response regulator protein-glutamate methylesterase [Zymomonas mobilis subsp. pomaceae]|uniref:Protein-glutamate methylesterase/protein-glutamine glutaminase n=1 Tax=Zymomonas mobilis subsp. pomaceae (strain ATCC 29192 / DSM 22645 / JCM 10191 / CCUG 17912 / NBRC 13757 / NCIMB 11200 / NRRL B-4491 / Barker I) TaxID=579138 RepID=F8ETH9_ZYMMT|nr:chemotaxis response regulator protein-glutamate methylesterase [Zymomonas mobilis]AEI38004.1 response regulator receiver modulated CheB methylesterase [Zymomonas mobilis subsp. pomaceae ATCC 29192]MDX5949372.1 chemotaxis response regulator protein-glutamate methylesterase [Zymomonas mobilis subsp. pomaceae]GEB89114.1 chemotaxis response regulator protein-glutamate methylesterase [Zymomonas mobilis subsp. pomaceae]
MTVRVLIVDDSPTMRAILSMMISLDPEIEVVGKADCPSTARQMIKELNPDVMTLDIEMPGMDGLDFLEKVMRLRPMPVIMVSALTAAGAEATLKAMELGAFDCFAKPALGFASDRSQSLALIEMIKAAAKSGGHRPIFRRHSSNATQVKSSSVSSSGYRPKPGSIIAIGASTGGVETLLALLKDFPENCPPTLIVQHMPPLFTTSFANRLNRMCPPTVSEAKTGDPLIPGHVYVAPGGDRHLEFQNAAHGPRCILVADEPMSGHRPSVDRMFLSVAKNCGRRAVGVILTGMGQDGAIGLKAMRDTGSFTIGQDEESCVVYGMPAAAFKQGAVEVQLSLSKIAARALEACA